MRPRRAVPWAVTDPRTGTTVETVLEQARDAARQGAWTEALALFARLDAADMLAEDLEALADAAWWSCRIDDSIAARQRAYAGYLAAANTRRAAYAAWLLSQVYGMKGNRPSDRAGSSGRSAISSRTPTASSAVSLP